MPKNLVRIYGRGHLHFITSSCYRRLPLLGTAAQRTLFLKIFEQVRLYYRFRVIGYVVMPEHIHRLMGEPARGDPSRVMQALKRRTARRLLSVMRSKKKGTAGQASLWMDEVPHLWQRRFYDFNVTTEKKRIEKLRYMHRNPVKRRLVASADLWRWSSFRFYRYGEEGVVKVEPIGW